MSIIDKLFRRKKELQLDEVRIEEKRLELKEHQMVKKLETLDREKQDLFKMGAETKSKALRRIYARKFEESTKNMQLVERELVRVGKELRLLSRIRMVLERSGKSPLTTGLLQRLNEGQMQDLMRMIDADNIKEAEFMEKLDIMLGLTEDREQVEGLGDEGNEVMKIWEKMDQGEFEFEEGLKEASRTITKEPREEEKKEAESDAEAS